MAATVNASHGVMRTLPRKLDSLLLLPPPPPPPAQPSLRKGEKKKILLLKGDLQDLLDDYLTEPSDSTAACWAKEVRELSYDVDDFLDELTIQLLHCDGHGSSSTSIAAAAAAAAKKTSMIARLRRELNRRRWIADEVTRLRARVKEAIRRHERYNLGRCTGSRPPIKDDDEERRRFLSLTLGMDLHGPFVGKDSFMKSPVVQLLTDGEPMLKVGSVLGFGGVGKTTVATEIYRLHGRRFDCRAFVRTSRKPDMTKILTDMLSQLRPQHRHQSPDVWEVDLLIETIRAHLQDKNRQRGEEEMPFGVEGMLTECHTMDEFSYLIGQAMESGKLVVIEFGASWCEPSRRIAPVFAEYAKEFAGAVFLKVDIDELEEIADSYHVDGVVPTFAFVKAGQKIDMIQGARSLRSKIQMHTASPYFLFLISDGWPLRQRWMPPWL